jgi:starch synthase (maltosyl-transferring)
MNYRLTDEYPLLRLATDELELAFSCDDGRLTLLRRRDGPNLVGYGRPIATVDVALGEPEGWQAASAFVRFLAHRCVEEAGGVRLTVQLGLGSLIVEDSYLLQGPLISRRVAVVSLDETPQRVYGLRMLVPWVQVGSLQHSLLDAPGQSMRPRVPLTVAAAHQRANPPRRSLSPAPRQGQLFEPAPAQSAGLLGLHHSASHEALLCWYDSDATPACSEVDGNGQALSLGHRVALAGWLHADTPLVGGTQYLLPLQQPWPDALDSMRRRAEARRPRPLPAAPWVGETVFYSLHAAQHGGFEGLAAALPGLRELGVGALCLLPVWRYANPSGQPWDGNAEQTGNPNAILDLEALDPNLGAPDELRGLVEAAHARGLRVLLELPLVGVASASPYVAEQPELFAHDEQGRLLSLPGSPEVACYDWSRAEVCAFLREWALRQQRSYGVDGFTAELARDSVAARHPAAGVRRADALFGIARLLRDLRTDLKAIDPGLVVIGDLQGPLYGASLDACHDYMSHAMLYHLALGQISAEELGDWFDDLARLQPADLPRICFTESQQTGALNPLAAGLRGSRLGRMLLVGVVLCGFAPLLWAGQEQGQEEFVARLLRLSRQHPALRVGQPRYRVASTATGIFAVLCAHGDERLLGVLNVDASRRSCELALPLERLDPAHQRFRLRELLGDERWRLPGRDSWCRDELAQLRLTLDPYSAYCFAVEPQPQPLAEAAELLATNHI